MEKALNTQVNAELQSFYAYLSMTAYLQSINLPGVSNWMRVQAHEEMDHAMKIYDFVHERDGRVTLHTVPKPDQEWKNLMALFQAAYGQEEDIGRKIDALVDLAIKEGDHATHTFLQWFVTEQVEELAIVNDIIQKLKLIENAPGGLFFLDQDLGKRTGQAEA